MNIKFVLINLGEPYSTFSEIIGKYLKKNKKYKKKIVLIGNVKLFNSQLKKLNYFIKINLINNINEARNNVVNMIDIPFKFKKIFTKISSKSNKYLERSFKESLKLLKQNKGEILFINGPISKKTFLNKKYYGITEYLSQKTQSKKTAMLIYNNKISVTPLTTHIPIKYVSKKINKNIIYNNVKIISKFYKKNFKKKINIAVLGLNPHCETIDKYSEEEKIIKPTIKFLNKKGFNLDGPFSTDTFFLKKNLDKYDVVLGMYHDQVITPLKTLFNFNAINITVGLPFIRISPDHGPNSEMLGKNKSDPSSFIYAMKFAEKLK